MKFNQTFIWGIVTILVVMFAVYRVEPLRKIVVGS